MKKIVTSLLLFTVVVVSAHEFWLQPDKFIYKKGETATIKFRVGENFEGENWNNNRSKINFLTLYTKGNIKDLSSRISDNKGDSLRLTLDNDGTGMIVYCGLNSYIELEAVKFNAYLEEDGLRETIDYRKLHNETDSTGRESYQRSVKTILQVGANYDSVCLQPTALPLDVIPLDHPYLMRDKQRMKVKILFNRQPLVDQLVRVWCRKNDKTMIEEFLTDQDGVISFKVLRSGNWMVSTVKMVRLNNDPKAQWQSYWGSCTWGYQ